MKHDRALVREQRIRHIRMRRRDWMTDPAVIGKIAKTKLQRGDCYNCEYCIRNRTYRDQRNAVAVAEAIREFA